MFVSFYCNVRLVYEDEEELEQGGQMGVKDSTEKGTYLKVTLQRLSKAKRDPTAIVPKLEAAIAPQCVAAAARHIQTMPLARRSIRSHGPHPNPHPDKHTQSHTPTPTIPLSLLCNLFI